LAIGLGAVRRLEDWVDRFPELFARASTVPAHLTALAPYLPVGEGIEQFWLNPDNRDNTTWTGHGDINSVMLATALVPDGFLTLTARPG